MARLAADSTEAPSSRLRKRSWSHGRGHSLPEVTRTKGFRLLQRYIFRALLLRHASRKSDWVRKLAALIDSTLL